MCFDDLDRDEGGCKYGTRVCPVTVGRVLACVHRGAARASGLLPTAMASDGLVSDDAYLSAHSEQLERSLGDAITQLVAARPDNSHIFVAAHLIRCSPDSQPRAAPSPERQESHSGPSTWTASAWMAGLHLEGVLVDALLGAAARGSSLEQLAALRSLGRADNMAELLLPRLCAAFGELAARLEPELRSLAFAEAVRGDELHSKFAADGGAFTLSYGGLSAFFGVRRRRKREPAAPSL